MIINAHRTKKPNPQEYIYGFLKMFTKNSLDKKKDMYGSDVLENKIKNKVVVPFCYVNWFCVSVVMNRGYENNQVLSFSCNAIRSRDEV